VKCKIIGRIHDHRDGITRVGRATRRSTAFVYLLSTSRGAVLYSLPHLLPELGHSLSKALIFPRKNVKTVLILGASWTLLLLLS